MTEPMKEFTCTWLCSLILFIISVIYCLTVFPSFFLSLCFWTPKYLRIMLKFHFLGACLLLTYLLILKFLGKYEKLKNTILDLNDFIYLILPAWKYVYFQVWPFCIVLLIGGFFIYRNQIYDALFTFSIQKVFLLTFSLISLILLREKVFNLLKTIYNHSNVSWIFIVKYNFSTWYGSLFLIISFYLSRRYHFLSIVFNHAFPIFVIRLFVSTPVFIVSLTALIMIVVITIHFIFQTVRYFRSNPIYLPVIWVSYQGFHHHFSRCCF